MKMSAQQNRIALPLRNHTILGVCEAIGEDFGFNPVLLRVPFAAMVLWSPVIAIASYFAVGALVLLSRVLFPDGRSTLHVVEQPSSALPAKTVEPELELAA